MSNSTNRWKEPCHLLYDSYETRLRSFITLPRYLKPDPTTLGIAGFWYTGKHPKQIVMTHALPNTHLSPFIFSPTGSGDTIICFHYGMGLQDWYAADDPWAQHAFWSPFCVYVRYIRGNRFIEQCSNMRDS
jgi:E3 ubiquitin-protein ligase XIAP